MSEFDESSHAGGLLLDYLSTLSPNVLEKLHESSGSALAILVRALPSAEQLFLSRLAFICEPISSCMLKSWFRLDNASKFDRVLRHLTDLRILLSFSEGVDNSVILSPNFQPSICSGISSGEISSCCFDDITDNIEEKHRKKLVELEEYGSIRWEALLQFMALPSRGKEEKANTMTHVLKFAEYIRFSSDAPSTSNVMETDDDETQTGFEISSDGFKFLLMKRTNQIWTYLIEFLKFTVDKQDENYMIDCLTFLLRLSFCVPGKAYKMQDTPDHLLEFVQHLRELGLMFMRKRKDGWFYATPLIHHLTGAAAHAGDNQHEGFLIVETNFRVVAYTDSDLELAILSTFVDLDDRFSNVSVGSLTRDSVRRALTVGIKAEQIIDYLRSHAHDQVKSRQPIIPPSVTDQIRLWEYERERLRFDEAVHYSNFDSDADFQILKDFAVSIDCVLWSEDRTRQVVVSSEGHDRVKQFWKKKSKEKR